MIRRRNLLFIVVTVVLLFLISTNYLLLNLQSSDIEVRKLPTIEEKIYLELQILPDHYKQKRTENLIRPDLFIINTKNTSLNFDNAQFEILWKEANSWVSKTRIVNFNSRNIGKILQALTVAEITKADLDTRGTQLKFLLTLQVRYFCNLFRHFIFKLKLR